MTRVLEEALRRHFTRKKLEIAYAIHEPFPFVESLLDNAFITENFYRESLEAWRNLVPVSRVIYNILAKLEKTFNLSLLKTLFQPLHLYEYPNLKRTFKSFCDVVSSHGGWSTLTAILDLADTAEWSSHQPRMLPQPTPQQPSSSLQPQPPTVTKPKGSKPEGSTPHSTEIRGEQPSPAAATPGLVGEGRLTPDNLVSQVNDGDSPEKPGVPPDSVQVSSDKPAPQGKDKENAPEMPSVTLGPVPMIREDSPEPNDSKEPQEVAPETPKKGKKRKRNTLSSSRKRDHKKSLPRGAASPDPKIQEQLQVGDQETPWKDDFAGKPRIVTRTQKPRSQRAPMSGPEEISDDTLEMNGERAQEPLSTSPRSMHGDDEDGNSQGADLTDHESKVPLGQSPGKKQKRRKQDSWSSPKRTPKNRRPGGAALPDHGIQEQLQVGDQATPRKDNSAGKPQVVKKAQKARSKCAPEDPEDHESQVSLGQSAEKKKRRKQDSWSSPKRTPKNRRPGGAASPGRGTRGKSQVRDQATPRKDYSSGQRRVVTRTQKARNQRAPKTGPEGKSEDESKDFNSPILPVICGDVKGFLYKEKMKQGSSEKCIQNETGVWFTPKEFEIEGKRANSKKWKRSVRCRGQTLEQLLKDDAPECEVCCRGGAPLRCAACARAFHAGCHVPPPPAPAEAGRSPWSCTFCRVKAASGGQQRRRGGSEVLARRMQPEEQLQCEFLLLKAYCHPQSSFFAEIPQNIQDYGEPFQEAMWLGLIKERLAGKVYTAAWFVRDMRLIFRNHKTFYKASDFGQVGLDLEAEFEKDLKELLIFPEASENSFQAT